MIETAEQEWMRLGRQRGFGWRQKWERALERAANTEITDEILRERLEEIDRAPELTLSRYEREFCGNMLRGEQHDARFTQRQAAVALMIIDRYGE